MRIVGFDHFLLDSKNKDERVKRLKNAMWSRRKVTLLAQSGLSIEVEMPKMQYVDKFGLESVAMLWLEDPETNIRVRMSTS